VILQPIHNLPQWDRKLKTKLVNIEKLKNRNFRQISTKCLVFQQVQTGSLSFQ